MTVLTVNVRRRYSALVTIPLDGFLNFNPSATFTPGDLKLVRPAQQKVCSLRSTRTNRAANSRSPLTMIISRARTPTLMRRRRLTPPRRRTGQPSQIYEWFLTAGLSLTARAIWTSQVFEWLLVFFTLSGWRMTYRAVRRRNLVTAFLGWVMSVTLPAA